MGKRTKVRYIIIRRGTHGSYGQTEKKTGSGDTPSGALGRIRVPGDAYHWHCRGIGVWHHADGSRVVDFGAVRSGFGIVRGDALDAEPGPEREYLLQWGY